MSFITFILISTAVFSGIILVLILLLSWVEAKVAQKGQCQITINDGEEPLSVDGGKSLLMVLANNKIFLPSACGGKGTCATCRCQVLEGGGDILPTETCQLTRKEQKEQYRLSCQVKVREDMKILVPEEIFNIKEYQCTVRSNRNVATFIKELVLEIEEPVEFQSGGYIQINVPPYKKAYREFDIGQQYREDWESQGLFGLEAENEEPVFRAYSMASHPGEKGLIILNVRIAPPPLNDMSLPPGLASSYIFQV